MQRFVTSFKRALFVISVSSLLALAQQSDPVLKPFGELRYPVLAKTARIQGEVKVEFFVNHSGDVVSVNLLSGHPMLADAATDAVRKWKFQMPKEAPEADQHYETVFSFELSDTPLDGGETIQKVIVDSFRHIRILTEPTSIDGNVYHSHCPSAQEQKTPPAVTDHDSIEMTRSGCNHDCASYTVRVYANGLVEWDGKKSVNGLGSQRGSISPTNAHALIESFRTSDFWTLCGSYFRSSNGGDTTILNVHIGNRTKTVSNQQESAPDWLTELEDSIDDAADTHQWRHGDPFTEPLVHISDDAIMPKPGVTPLMRAAASGDLDKIIALLRQGTDIRQADSSGWTVLMYANPNSCGGGGDSVCISVPHLLELLIAAGADVNYSSPRGDTPLMAAAYDERFEKDLVKGGANINAQNLDGVSALMILATMGRPDAVQAALTAGANAKLKDNQGRTALDYLRLANCDQSPVRNPLEESTPRKKDCDNLIEDDFEKIKDLLQQAMAAP